MGCNPSLKSSSHTSSQEIRLITINPVFYCCVYHRSPVRFSVSHMFPIHSPVTRFFFKMCFDSIATYEISGFRREVDENCTFLGCYTAYSGNFVQTFREKPLGPNCKDQLSWILITSQHWRQSKTVHDSMVKTLQGMEVGGVSWSKNTCSVTDR
jgi:hypothetical protein